MDDDQQILLSLMSFNILIVTVECAFGLGREIQPGYSFLLLIPLMSSFIGFMCGLSALFNKDKIENALRKNRYSLMISATMLIVVSFSPYVYSMF